MSGLFVSLGAEPTPDSLAVVSHRGRAVQEGQTFLSAAGTVHLRCTEDSLQAAGTRERAASAGASGLPNGIVFDGSIYNAAELRQRFGHQGGPARDGDLVLDLLSARGLDGLAEVNGEFAFVAFDSERQELIAARDRFGLKPLYVYVDATRLAFASEIKQFFALPGVAARLNPSCTLDFLIAGLTDHADGTMFAGVQRLPAGAALRLDLRAWRLGHLLPPACRTYELPVSGSLELDELDARQRFRQLFIDAVRVRWQPDAEPGLCLSGGLDSAAVACVAAFAIGERRRGRDLITFKAFFGDPRYDEPHLFQSVLEHTKAVNHRSCCRGPDALAIVDRLVWHLDEPYSRASLAAQWQLFAQAEGAGIRVTLDGQGSDELLGGYLSMVHAHEAYLAMQPSPGADASSRSSMGRAAPGDGARRYRWLRASWRSAATDRFAAPIRPPYLDLGQLCRERIYQGDLPMMMRHNDRIGMAHGVETRVPFLDHRLVELCIGLGNRFKYVHGQTKYLLRRALGDLVPQAVLQSNFKGSYSELEEGWLRGAAAQELVAKVMAAAGQWPEIFDAAGIRSLTRNPRQADKETLMLLWRILCFGAWARRFEVRS